MIEEIDGTWWIPENVDFKVQGTLKIDEDSINLDLVRGLKIDTKPEDQKIILGVDRHGKLITLYKPIFIDPNFAYISISYIIFNYHYTKVGEMKFKSLFFHFRNFAEWMNKSVINFNVKTENKLDVSVNGYSYKYQLDEFNLEIKYTPLWEGSRTYLNIKHDPLIMLNVKNSISLEDFINLVIMIQEFFILLANDKIIPYGFRSLDPNNKELSIIFREFNEPYVEHYFGEEIPFLKIDKELDRLLKNWLTKSDKLKTSGDLFFGLIYSESIYSEFKLLAYTQLLESYHRNVFGGKYMDIDKYQQVKTKITNSIPPEIGSSHKESLKNKIKYGYEYSLRKRIRRIIKEYWDDYFNLFIQDKDIFENQIIDTRNFHTHYDESSEAEFIQEDESLVLLNLRLKLLCYLLFLIQIDVPNSLVLELLQNSGTKNQIEYMEKR